MPQRSPNRTPTPKLQNSSLVFGSASSTVLLARGKRENVTHGIRCDSVIPYTNISFLPKDIVFAILFVNLSSHHALFSITAPVLTPEVGRKQQPYTDDRTPRLLTLNTIYFCEFPARQLSSRALVAEYERIRKAYLHRPPAQPCITFSDTSSSVYGLMVQNTQVCTVLLR